MHTQVCSYDEPRMDNHPAVVEETVPPVAVAPSAPSAPVEHMQAEATPAVPVAAVADDADDAAGTGAPIEATEDCADDAKNTAHRQLKELRSLMPWNWDARIEDHPPGEKAMVDFEDVVNYKYDGRRRARSLSAVEEVARFQKAEEARVERERKRLARVEREKTKKTDKTETKGTKGTKETKKKAEELKGGSKSKHTKETSRPSKTPAKKKARSKAKADDSNKENVEPASDNVAVDAAVTPAVGRRNQPRNCTKPAAEHAVTTTPGLVLTPVADGAVPTTGKRAGGANRTNKTSSNLKRASTTTLTAEKNAKRQAAEKPKSRRVTFGSASARKTGLAGSVGSVGSAGKATVAATPATVAAKSRNRTPRATGAVKPRSSSRPTSRSHRATQQTNRVVNFPPSLTIDLDKYGYGIGIRRPPGCPPLFRAVEDAGRATVPSLASLPLEMFTVPALPVGEAMVPRVCSPYHGRPEAVRREEVLVQLIQAGVSAASELGEMMRGEGALGSSAGAPCVLSPELMAALAALDPMA